MYLRISKNTIILGILIAVSLTTGTQTVLADETLRLGFFQRTFGTLNWEQAKTVVSSPKEASLRVRRHVNYREDLSDKWDSGRETWTRGYGDCEDMAAAVIDLCKSINAEASIIVFYPKGKWEAHAVAIGTWKGRMWMSSNGWYESVDSINDAKRKVAKEMRWKETDIQILDESRLLALITPDLNVAAKAKIAPL